MYYFLKSEQAAKQTRLRLLSSQVDESGNPLIASFRYVKAPNTDAATKVKAENPLGTVFVVNDLKKGAGFYETQDIPMPCTGPNATKAFEDLFQREYLDKVHNPEALQDNAKPLTVPKARKVRTRLENLLDTYPHPSITESGYYIDPDIWDTLLLLIDNKDNIMLTGPTGSAKTEIIQYLAKLYKVNLVQIDMSAQQDPVSGLIGVHRLEKGSSVFDFAPFAKAIQQPNTWVLCDEINRGPMTAGNILLPCTDGRRFLDLSIASSKVDRQLKVHPDVVFFATANLGSEYSGTNSIDRALQDRFDIVGLDYPPKEKESEILSSRVGIEILPATVIAECLYSLRELQRASDFVNSPSVRHSLKIAVKHKKGMPLEKALLSTIDSLYEQNEKEAMKAVVAGIVSKQLK